jgi:wyosine [tRNA(Phe)-imidazoG37] synthetase (radical SAM superfamily)
MNANPCIIECAPGIGAPGAARRATAFGCPRDFMDNRFVYSVISPRARGLSIGINMNPDKRCNFDCIYCEVNRGEMQTETELDVAVMAVELQKTLILVQSGQIRARCAYNGISNDLLQLRHVALSGDGEPTLCPNFSEAVEAVVHVRARASFGFFKVVLITNGTGLDLPSVQPSLKYFTAEDEIWIKLDAGTQQYMDKINRSEVSLDKVMSNILLTAQKRSVVIQSLFAQIDHHEPPPAEIDEYLNRLKQLKEGGARISLVQIYSATRPMFNGGCDHLPLRFLSGIRQRIKAIGLKAEVF